MNTEVVVDDTPFNIPENAKIVLPARQKTSAIRFRKVTKEEALKLHEQGVQVYYRTLGTGWNFPDMLRRGVFMDELEPSEDWCEWAVEDAV